MCLHNKHCLRLEMAQEKEVFLTITREEYVALPPWPFSQIVALMLLDQYTSTIERLESCTYHV